MPPAVNKQCQACGAYYAGALDGDYVCAACHASGAVVTRKLAALDDSNANANGDGCAAPSRRVNRHAA